MIWPLLWIVLLVAASAFFVAAEFALIAARRSAIELVAVGSPRARRTLAAMDNVSVMLACAQLGITVCGLVLGAVGEPAIAHLLEPLLADAGLGPAAVDTIALIIGLLIVVAIHVAFGEMVPKNIALTSPERTAVLLAPMLRAVAVAIGPIVRGLDHLANLCIRAVGVTPSSEIASTVTRGELVAMVAASAREGLLDSDDERLIDAALDFGRTRAADIALEASGLVLVGPHPTAAEVEQACARSGFSRFPVRAGHEPAAGYAGYVHVRDVLAVPTSERDLALPATVIRSLPQLPGDALLRAAMDTMQRERAHMCAVAAADGPDSVLLLEDAVEVLVGEIVDATRRSRDR